MQNLKQKTLQGVSWVGIATLINQSKALIIGIILARLLDPVIFGLMSMMMVILEFANRFKDLGFGAALIERNNINENHLSSTFWLNIGIGTLLTVFFYLSAPFIANFYNENQLIPLIKVMSVNFLIGSALVIQNTLKKRDLDFKFIAIANALSGILSGITAITLAWLGFGVWALVVQIILNNTINLVAHWLYSNWKPKFIFNTIAIKELFDFSIGYMGVMSLNYWTRKLDDLLIGKFLGTSQLGLYSKAYSFLMFPISNIKQQIIQVLFPAFAKIKDKKETFRQGIIKVLNILALIIFPLVTCLLISTKEFVLGLLGNQWIAIVPLIKIFCFSAYIQAISINGFVLFSLGKSATAFKFGLLSKGLFIIAIIIGLNWSIIGVCWAVLFGAISNFIILDNLVTRRIIKLNFLDAYKEVFIIIIVLIVISLFVYIIDYFFLSKNHLILNLILKSSILLSIYGVSILYLKRELINYLITSFRGKK